MESTEVMTIQQYNEWKDEQLSRTDSRVIEAYEIRQEIEQLEDELKFKREYLRSLLKDVGTYHNELYSVTNMKLKARRLDMEWIRANMPHLLQYAEPSDKFVLSALRDALGYDEVKRIVENSSGYQDALYLSVKAFDEHTGDSSKKRMFAGQAYHNEWVPTNDGEYCVEYIARPPQLPHFNPYPTHDDEGDDDEW